MSVVTMLLATARIAPQFGVPLHLRRLQQSDSREVVFEMSVAELGLRFAYIGRGDRQIFRCYFMVCE